jgi:DNA polymerase III alpha subunit
MLFLTLADRSGLAECVLFPNAYRALARAVRGQIVRVEGRVGETLGALTVTLTGATEIGAPAASASGVAAVTRHGPAPGTTDATDAVRVIREISVDAAAARE